MNLGIAAGGTHFPILAGAVARTTGPVLELGIGDYSTPMLHFMCEGIRNLYSFEISEEWLSGFRQYQSSTHFLDLIPSWDKFDTSGQWSVAFVDCAPGEDRVPLIKSLKDNARFIITHDTEANGYNWEQLEGVFKYQTTWKEYPTWTTVYSNVEEFKL